MPVEVMAAVAVGSTFFGFKEQKKASKQAKASALAQSKARDTDNKINAVKAQAARAGALRKQRALVARNIASSFQGATGGGSSTTSAGNSGLVTNTAVNLGRQTEVQGLGVERNNLLQQANNLSASSQVASSNAGFLFQVAQQTMPTKQEFQDMIA